MEEQLASSPVTDQTQTLPYADCPAVSTDADLQIPPSATYAPVDLQDPMFLGWEIRKLWAVHQQYEADVKVERSKLLEVGSSLGELLYAMKRLLAICGRAGRWSAFLRENRIGRASADRLVSKFAAAKGLTQELTHRAISEPNDGQISTMAHRTCDRVESKLPSQRSRYMFVHCMAALLGLEVASTADSMKILNPECASVANGYEAAAPCREAEATEFDDGVL